MRLGPLALKVLVATSAGLVIGLVVGYIPSLVVYAVVAGLTQNTSRSGGWGAAGTLGGIAWLASAGLIVGLLQDRAFPPQSRSWGWIVIVGALWAASHPVDIVLRGLAGDVDLVVLLPWLVAACLAVGLVRLLRA